MMYYCPTCDELILTRDVILDDATGEWRPTCPNCECVLVYEGGSYGEEDISGATNNH
jgi:hypothetical protein